MRRSQTESRPSIASRASRLLSVAVAMLGTSAALSTARSADGEPATVACVETWGEARYRNYGYDHIVHLRNRCEKAVICRVSSNVNPDPSEVTVASKMEAEVMTFRGSPAREFVPKVDCRLLM